MNSSVLVDVVVPKLQPFVPFPPHHLVVSLPPVSAIRLFFYPSSPTLLCLSPTPLCPPPILSSLSLSHPPPPSKHQELHSSYFSIPSLVCAIPMLFAQFPQFLLTTVLFSPFLPDDLSPLILLSPQLPFSQPLLCQSLSAQTVFSDLQLPSFYSGLYHLSSIVPRPIHLETYRLR